jgi:hypothetical protein
VQAGAGSCWQAGWCRQAGAGGVSAGSRQRCDLALAGPGLRGRRQRLRQPAGMGGRPGGGRCRVADQPNQMGATLQSGAGPCMHSTAQRLPMMATRGGWPVAGGHLPWRGVAHRVALQLQRRATARRQARLCLERAWAAGLHGRAAPLEMGRCDISSTLYRCGSRSCWLPLMCLWGCVVCLAFWGCHLYLYQCTGCAACGRLWQQIECGESGHGAPQVRAWVRVSCGVVSVCAVMLHVCCLDLVRGLNGVCVAVSRLLQSYHNPPSFNH